MKSAIAAILASQIALVTFSVYTNHAVKSENIGAVLPIKGSKLGEWAETCTSPCIFPAEFRGGGDIALFNNAAMILLSERKDMVINADVCISACTIIVDTVHKMGGQVCIDKDTVLGYHRGSRENTETGEFLGYFDYAYSNPMLAWHLTEHPLDSNGNVEFFNVGFWSAMYPVCTRDYKFVVGPAMEDGKGNGLDNHSI